MLTRSCSGLSIQKLFDVAHPVQHAHDLIGLVYGRRQ